MRRSVFPKIKKTTRDASRPECKHSTSKSPWINLIIHKSVRNAICNYKQYIEQNFYILPTGVFCDSSSSEIRRIVTPFSPHEPTTENAMCSMLSS